MYGETSHLLVGFRERIAEGRMKMDKASQKTYLFAGSSSRLSGEMKLE